MSLLKLIAGTAGTLLLLLGPLACLGEEALAPDEVLLQNGSRILGTVTGARGGVVSVDTDFAGTLAIKLEDIAALRTRNPMQLQLADRTVITQQALQLDGDTVQVADEAGNRHNYALDELLVLNPDAWELGQGYHWKGLISLAMAAARGNSNTDELDYRLETRWRSVDDRYTLNMYAENDEANDEKSADNWSIQGKYDYFLNDLTYWGGGVFAESDEFRDLDLRAFAGPYVGREFYTDPVFEFSAEVGVSYVTEDFIVAEDQDYPAANWSIKASSNYLGGDSRLYLDQIGIWNLDETEDVILKTRFGLAFPLLWRLEAAAEVVWEYDSGAVEGIEELDETYSFRVGYSW